MKKICTALIVNILTFSVYAQIFDVDTIQYRGNTDTLINIVFLGDGYMENEMEQFVIAAQNTTTNLLSEAPFSNYRNYFNVFLIKVPSNESGAAINPDNLIDNYFGSTFWYAGIERLLVPTNIINIMNVLANNFPVYDQVFMIVNSSKYGGSGGFPATFSTEYSSFEIAKHELGHSFASLADEYWAGEVYAHEATNMTQETNIEVLRWKNWYGDFNIGLYPHGESPTWYRPHQNCMMRFLGNPYCSVCAEGLIERIHSLVSPLRSFDPDSANIAPSNFPLKLNIDLIEPDPNTLKITWKINDLVFDMNTDSVLIDSGSMEAGLNAVTVTIEDTTQLLRVDNHLSIHLSVVSWNIDNTITDIRHLNVITNNLLITLFPNPIQNYLNIKYQGEIKGTLRFEIVDLSGKVLVSSTPDQPEFSSIYLGDLKPGTYIVKFYMNNILITSKKLIKN